MIDITLRVFHLFILISWDKILGDKYSLETSGVRFMHACIQDLRNTTFTTLSR